MTNKFHTMTSIRRGVVRPTLLFSATYLLLSAKDCGRLLSKNISENLGALTIEDISKNQTTNSTAVPSALPSNDQGGTVPKSHKANNLNQPNQSSEPNQPNAPNAPNPLNPLNEPHKPNKPNQPGGPVSAVASLAGKGTVLNIDNYSCGLFIASETGEAFIVQLPAEGGWMSLLQEDSDSRSLQFRYDAVPNPCILKIDLAFVDLLCQRLGHSVLTWHDVAFFYKPSMVDVAIFTEEGFAPSTEFTTRLYKIKTDGDGFVQPIIADSLVVPSMQSAMPDGVQSLPKTLPVNLGHNPNNDSPVSSGLQEPLCGTNSQDDLPPPAPSLESLYEILNQTGERKDSGVTNVLDNTDHIYSIPPDAVELSPKPAEPSPKSAGQFVFPAAARQGACGSVQFVSSTSVPPSSPPPMPTIPPPPPLPPPGAIFNSNSCMANSDGEQHADPHTMPSSNGRSMTEELESKFAAKSKGADVSSDLGKTIDEQIRENKLQNSDPRDESLRKIRQGVQLKKVENNDQRNRNVSKKGASSIYGTAVSLLERLRNTLSSRRAQISGESSGDESDPNRESDESDEWSDSD